MINVCVFRNPCTVTGSNCSGGSDLCRTGPDISDALLVTDEAAKERGKAEIDESYTNRKIVTGNIYLRPWIQPGSILHITDVEEGEYRAMLRGMSVNISRDDKDKITATASIQFEKHYDD